MKNVRIDKPCSENWNEMLPTEKGAFCQQCAAEVIDFTSKSNAEIKGILSRLVGKPVCSRIRVSQMESLSAEMDAWQLSTSRQFQSTLLLALVLVFGLTLFSCSSPQEKETILKMQETVSQVHVQETKPAEIQEAPAKSELEQPPYPVEIPVMQEVYRVEQPAPGPEPKK